MECSDVDECSAGLHNCDKNSFCINTDGAHACVCIDGFSGNGLNCEEDDDSCDPDCGINAHCKKGRRGRGRQTRKPSVCECNEGYEGDPITECTDIDECLNDPCGKNEMCLNYDGGHICKCAPGYESNLLDKCVDIDECSANNLNNCDSVNGICFNYDGGYTCSCKNGYKGNGITCDDDDECESGTDVCSDNAKCANTIGSYTCACNENYSGNGYECIRDEPETCDPICGDHSYCDTTELTCKCLPGFEMIDGDCVDIDECKTIKSPNSRLRQMTILGTLRLSQKTCSDPNSECLNLEGSFVCPCKAGYKHSKGKCVNIDECTKDRLNSCSENAICTDLDGLYTCECKNGYIGNGIICNKDPCDHCGDASCDANGKCQCPTGFVFQDKTCVDINECDRTDSPCQSNSKCINTDGSYVCNCFVGYITAGDNTCDDIDECKAGAHNCDPNAFCTNYDGGYNCACEEGFKGNGLTCDDVDECELNLCGSNAVCTNTIGDFECKCKDGFIKNQNESCEAIEDPCETGNHDCDVSNSECEITRDSTTNHINGFVCKCKPGYEELETFPVQCRDIDECAQDTHSCTTDQQCMNTDGSYECGCPSGFKGDGITCDDIDECNDGTDTCTVHSTCINTIGSYECNCNDGFDGETCSDIDECTLGIHQCHENGVCHNNDGSYTCTCNESFEGDGIDKCSPVEECDPEDPACDFHELTFGDPHFLFHQGKNERICFNYDGSLEFPMLLVADDATGFYITGKLEKAGRGSAFREITIMTPDGIVAVFDKNGVKEISGANKVDQTSDFIAGDLEVQKVKGSKNSWKIRVGSGIEIIIERRHVST